MKNKRRQKRAAQMRYRAAVDCLKRSGEAMEQIQRKYKFHPARRRETIDALWTAILRDRDLVESRGKLCIVCDFDPGAINGRCRNCTSLDGIYHQKNAPFGLFANAETDDIKREDTDPCKPTLH